MEDLIVDPYKGCPDIFEQMPVLSTALSQERSEVKSDREINIIPATSLAFRSESYTMQIGGTKIINIIPSPSCSSCPLISWASSNNSVVIVDDDLNGSSLDNSANAMLIAKGLGTATITAYSSELDITCTCTVEVIATPPVVTPSEPEEPVTYTVSISSTGTSESISSAEILNANGEAKTTFEAGDVVSLKITYDMSADTLVGITEQTNENDAVVPELDSNATTEQYAIYTFTMPARNVELVYTLDIKVEEEPKG